MRTILTGLLLVQVLVRPYFNETIDHLPLTRHRHVQISGKVMLVRHEADGDIHIRIIDSHGPKHYVICEIVPYHPLPAPKIGQLITVKGLAGYDPGHGWWEIHPVESWEEWTYQWHK
jgi:hypothetical protein